MAPLFITVPWDLHFDQALAASDCQNATDITENLTQHTNYSCLAAIDMGAVYGTHSVDYATWDGASCVTCDVAGNSSDWKWVSKPGTIGYVRRVKESDRSYRAMLKYDMNGDGVVDAGDMAASMLHADKELEDAEGSLELLEARVKANIGGNDEDGDDDDDDDEVAKETTAAAAAAVTAAVGMQTNLDQDTVTATAFGDTGVTHCSINTFENACLASDTPGDCHWCSNSHTCGAKGDTCPSFASRADVEKRVSSGGGSVYMLKSFNYGGGTTNWTYTLMPAHIGVPGFITDPTNQSVIYTVNAGCIAASYDTGDTWSPCWNQPQTPPAMPHVGLVGSFNDMAIKDSQHMIVNRDNDVPLRTTDGGATWTPMDSCKLVANFRTGLSYSWTAKTLVLMGAGGTQSADHPHAAFVWISKDDGETWTDETSSMLVTMGPGEANWYENDFYINSMGQGIMVKTLE
jgi:hypothetical protein